MEEKADHFGSGIHAVGGARRKKREGKELPDRSYHNGGCLEGRIHREMVVESGKGQAPTTMAVVLWVNGEGIGRRSGIRPAMIAAVLKANGE